MVKSRKYVVKKYFKGLPKKEDFELVEYELPPLKDGEFLVKAEWISVDPYLRAANGIPGVVEVPYDQFSYQVGLILESKNPDFPVGARAVSHKGWTDYGIVDGSPDQFGLKPYLLPDLKGLPNSVGVGAIGMPGVSAYHGFLEICKPKAGETVVVSGAAGAVGSIVGQIAKIKGCRVIGIAGSDDKVQWLEKELGFDKALNYKKPGLDKALKEATPEGIDCYFDNVGGELSHIVISQMNQFGRISVIGAISSYNDQPNDRSKCTPVQLSMVSKQLRMEGVQVSRYVDRWTEALDQLTEWITAGKMKAGEHVTEGFDNLIDALIGMLKGENTGKAVVKV